MKLSQQNTRHEIRYWPLYRKPEEKVRAFPRGFLFACFLALGLWVIIAYLLS